MTINNEWRTQPMYSFAEAAHLAHVSSSTVRNWLLGYKGKDVDIRPLFPSHGNQEPRVSFLELIEIALAAKFRIAEQVPYQRVRRAYENTQQLLGIEYPFAHVNLEALGGHIVHELQDTNPGTSLQSMDEIGQWTIPGLVLETVHQFDYDQELVARWYPVGRKLPIVVDPQISAGVPTIVGRGVSLETIRKRWKAGHKISFIASDLKLEREIVETALQYAEQVAA